MSAETDWMQPGVGVTATFDYQKKGAGSGMHRIYKRNRIEAEVAAEYKREEIQRMGFTCSPIVYRVGA